MIFNWYKTKEQKMTIVIVKLLLLLLWVCRCSGFVTVSATRRDVHDVGRKVANEHETTREKLDDVLTAVSHTCPGGQKWSAEYQQCWGPVCGKGTAQVLSTIVHQVFDTNTRQTVNLTQVQASCEPCSPGFYTENTGSKDCTACPVGKYQDGKDTTRCLSCKSGKTTFEGRAIRCVACTPGKFSTGCATYWNNQQAMFTQHS